MSIIVDLDADISTNAPPGFLNAVTYVQSLYNTMFSIPVDVTIVR